MSAAYAHTVGAAVGLAIVESDAVTEGATVEVDLAGSIVKATLSVGALYDPTGSRMRA